MSAAIKRRSFGPRLELFARKKRDGWKTWGDELPLPSHEAPVPDSGDDGLDVPDFLKRAAP